MHSYQGMASVPYLNVTYPTTNDRRKMQIVLRYTGERHQEQPGTNATGVRGKAAKTIQSPLIYNLLLDTSLESQLILYTFF